MSCTPASSGAALSVPTLRPVDIIRPYLSQTTSFRTTRMAHRLIVLELLLLVRLVNRLGRTRLALPLQPPLPSLMGGLRTTKAQFHLLIRSWV